MQYEVINLETKEVFSATISNNVDEQYTDVTFFENGEDKVVRLVWEVKPVTNLGNEGNLLNDKYAIRQVDTQLTPNVDGVVTDEGVEVPVSQETRAEIQAGNVDPDTIQ